MSERRRAPRARKRLGCDIRVGTHRHFGMVLNVSAEGLFVQTNARIEPGTSVDLTLGAESDRLHVALQGRVARAVRMPRQLASVVQSGLGIRLVDPPAPYRAFVAALLGASVVGASLPPPQPIEMDGAFSYRVEMRALSGAETRTLLVSCKSAAEAGELASAELDEGWKLVSVERV